jgi:hypothetical protein
MQTVRRLGRRNVGRHCFKKSKKNKKTIFFFFFFFCFVFFSFTHKQHCPLQRWQRAPRHGEIETWPFQNPIYSKHRNIDSIQRCRLLQYAAHARAPYNSNLTRNQKLLKTTRKQNTKQKNKKHHRNNKNQIKFERVIKMCEFQSVHSSATTCVVKPLNEGTCKQRVRR